MPNRTSRSDPTDPEYRGRLLEDHTPPAALWAEPLVSSPLNPPSRRERSLNVWQPNLERARLPRRTSSASPGAESIQLRAACALTEAVGFLTTHSPRTFDVRMSLLMRLRWESSDLDRCMKPAFRHLGISSLAGAVSLVAATRHGHTEPRPLNVSFALGAHAFAPDVELGAETMNAPGPATAGLVGARFGGGVARGIIAEAELVAIATRDDVLGERASVFGLRAQARLEVLELAGLRPLGGKLRPFVVAGVGVHLVRGGAPQLPDDTDACYQWGAGLGYALTDRFALRLDVRHLIVPDRTEDGATSDIEVSAGVAIALGGGAPPPPRRVLVAPPPAAPPPAAPPPAAPLSPATGTQLVGIQFEMASAQIAPASLPILDYAVDLLRADPALHVEIAGHTSDEGTEAGNLELSRNRALEVKLYLVLRGIAGERVTVTAHDSSRPIADNGSEASRARNRRVELHIAPQERR
jgi:outer membrane protein OmpA-like peptidoglycan-associated protein